MFDRVFFSTVCFPSAPVPFSLRAPLMIDLVPMLVVGAGVLQLPLLMDVVSHCWPGSRVGRAVTTSMRVLLLTCMLACCTAGLYLHLAILLPERMRPSAGAAADAFAPNTAFDPSWLSLVLGSPAGVIHVALSLWLYVQLMSYFAAACIEPASRIKPPSAAKTASPLPTTAPPPSASSSSSHSTDTISGNVSNGGDCSNVVAVRDPSMRWCNECNVPKLLRTHHCRVCRVCVELMDHRQKRTHMEQLWPLGAALVQLFRVGSLI